MTLTPTPGSATANSYASLLEAQAYASTLTFPGEWATVLDPAREAALQQAARWLDTLRWKGTKATAEQAMAWPRVGVVDLDGYTVEDVPQALKNAQAEFAVRLLSDDRAADAGGLAPETLVVGSLHLGAMQHRIVPASVLAMVRPFLASGGGMVGGVRG